ncbi:hypothetical protein Leryth_015749 [Lithospermum erythrorhizon]|nr:hypothetical protein Leryth_015749 [Lithospermum erythrorhizon]
MALSIVLVRKFKNGTVVNSISSYIIIIDDYSIKSCVQEHLSNNKVENRHNGDIEAARIRLNGVATAGCSCCWVVGADNES